MNIHIHQPFVPPSSAAALLLSPAARFTGVKPNIYECNRTKCGSIDLVCAHLCRYRAHIQHTRAIKYSYLSAAVPPSSAALLLSPAARFTGVKPNIYECNRTKCGNIDLVRAHLVRYRTHIQHTCAIKYSYLSAVVPPSSAAALLSPAARFTCVDPNTYECNQLKSNAAT